LSEAKQQYPEPTVGALVLNDEGEMLLVRSVKWGDKYTIAGGHVEVGEGLVEALRREIREEVGLEITGVRFFMTQEAIYSEEFWEPKHFIFFDYACRSRGGTPRVDGKEIQSFRWVRPERALALRLDSFTRRMVERFVSEGKTTRTRNARPAGGPVRTGRRSPRRRGRPARAVRRRET
jgi:nucleoside triphosphatase